MGAVRRNLVKPPATAGGSDTHLMKVLMIGDVVGKPGRTALLDRLQDLKEQHAIGFTVMNAENVVVEYIKKQPRLLRPANYPPHTPGSGMWTGEVKGVGVAVISLLGRVFMQPADDPFRIGNELVNSLSDEVKIRLVDMHAEATSEKMAMGWFLDGRVSAVLGTHTHVQTADERILAKGTAYITDVGCCAPVNGVIGMDFQAVFRRLVEQLPSRFEVATGPACAPSGCRARGTRASICSPTAC